MMQRNATRERAYIAPRNVRPFNNFDVNEYAGLSQLGISLDERIVRQWMKQRNNALVAMDVQPDITTPSIGTPIQFLQNWLPGFVYAMTGARKIDELIGIMITGAWEDSEVVQGILERTGTSLPYGDYTNMPESSWNVNFEKRSVVRFEEGMRVGIQEALEAARMQVDTSSAKRQSAALALEIQRNNVGFFGYNSGANRTYGFLNDPGLPNYVTVANGAAASPLWSSKTFLEICKDIRSAVVALRTQSQDNIDPESVDLTLAIATNSVDWLTTTSDFGISVRDWIKQTYPRMRIASAPQLNGANSGANVFYLYAESIADESTDGGRVFLQMVQSKFQVLGVQQQVKAYVEDFSCATAGVLCKRPWAVVRRSGI